MLAMGKAADIITDLGKVFANIVCGTRQIMTKWTSLASLASTLSEEFARDMRRICPCRPVSTQTEMYDLTHSVCQEGSADYLISVLAQWDP
jgi:hypothetical protein